MNIKSDRKKKLSIVGAGNAGCITAMECYLTGGDYFDDITIYYDPSSPMEKVGQGSTLSVSFLINDFFYLDFFSHNKIKSTRKEGILYENWGKKTEKIYHLFPQCHTSIHYVPDMLSKSILESGCFKVIEKSVKDLENEIDSDFIFDCRGRFDRDLNFYDPLINPLNSVILARKEEIDPNLLYTKCIATPNGWTFVIPNVDSTSYGYLFNDTITSKEDAYNNFIETFDVVPTDCFKFDNYIAKNCFLGERTILNGNRLSFLEPLEATSTAFYLESCSIALKHIIYGIDKKICNDNIRKEMFRIQNFVLWHYQFGSKYNTPFWEYAKSLYFDMDEEFKTILDFSINNSYSEILTKTARGYDVPRYSQWPPLSFKSWYDQI